MCTIVPSFTVWGRDNRTILSIIYNTNQFHHTETPGNIQPIENTFTKKALAQRFFKYRSFHQYNPPIDNANPTRMSNPLTIQKADGNKRINTSSE